MFIRTQAFVLANYTLSSGYKGIFDLSWRSQLCSLF